MMILDSGLLFGGPSCTSEWRQTVANFLLKFISADSRFNIDYTLPIL